MQTFENEKNLLDYCEKHNSKKVLMRFVADSNRRNRFCRPVPSHSANEPCFWDCKDSIILYLSKAFLTKVKKNPVYDSFISDLFGLWDLCDPAYLVIIYV